MDSVLNWLWQGCVVAVACGAMLRVLERARANVRYVVCWTALLLIVALPGLPSLQSAAAALDAVGDSAGPSDCLVARRLVDVDARDACPVDGMGERSRRQVRRGHRCDPSRARAQSCLPLAGGIAPAALALRPLQRGVARRWCCRIR